MSEARRLRAEQFVQQNGPVWFRSPDSQVPKIMAEFAEAEVRAAVAEAQQERDEARASALVLVHAYDTDTRPPARLIAVARTYPRDSRGPVPPGAPTR